MRAVERIGLDRFLHRPEDLLDTKALGQASGSGRVWVDDRSNPDTGHVLQSLGVDSGDKARTNQTNTSHARSFRHPCPGR